jgi:hypothetical protein
MTSITIPNSVTSIGYAAFQNCSGLTSVTIPNSVIELSSYAFDGTTWYNNQPDGLIYIGEVAYKYKGKMPDNTQITIKDGTRVIAGSTFFNCSGLTSIIIPNSVISIGDNAFWGCTALTSVTIPNRVSSICGGTFQDCTSLSSITIPDSVSSIGSYAFWGCSSLESVSIPNSVIRIGSRAFDGTKWYDNQPDGLVYAGKVALNYKGIMPANTHISIKDGTLGIAADAFSGSTLTSISLPNSMTFIGESALYWADLQIVISQIENPFSIQGSSENPPTFSYNTFEKATLYVPEGTIEKYRATDGWKDFENIETVANFVQMELQGDYIVQVPIGTTYIDAGFKATMNGQDASSFVVTSGLDNIDMNSIGIYDITYSVINDSAIPISVSRTVMVYDPTVETDLSGTWVTQPGTQRIYGGATVTPFADYICKIKKAAPGIFSVSDFFAGYYDQRAGYGSSYACKGYLGLRADNVLICLNNGVKGWGDSLDEGSFVGSYDPETETLTWQCDYANSMTFYIYLKSDDPRPTGIQPQKKDAEVYPTGIYTIDGKRISKPIRGLNIIRMNDGTTKKVIIR